MFDKILIANRGEIAMRVARTARRLGIRVVAVYSEADKHAPHVAAADEAVGIGPAAVSDSYLRIDRIVAAAKATGANAVHPGYGFLSENADFCESLEQEGIVFIGPTATTIRAMGSKSAAKDLMEKAGVPTLPGYQGQDQSIDVFSREAERIGYPVLLKATAGGGGKGMRLVEHPDQLEAALESARREAISSFDDDRFLIEKYLVRPRHVEVQVFGDGRGNVIHVFERDCSVQRRHQKVLEEAPAPNLPTAIREDLLQSGVRAAEAVDYRGAGTVEFLYDGAAGVFFMEMNTRLQVEHPVSEEVSGLDFVEWQFRIAAGETLPLKQSEIRESGHAFEARLYAEDADRNFAPSVGHISHLALPANARNDCGVEQGQEITPFYDPMISKIITHGSSRAAALTSMQKALENVRVVGPETNARFLHALCMEPDFADGHLSTGFIEEHSDTLFARADIDIEAAIAVALSEYFSSPPASGDQSPWSRIASWRTNMPTERTMFFRRDDDVERLTLYFDGAEVSGEWEPNATAHARRQNARGESVRALDIANISIESESVLFDYDGRRYEAYIAPVGNGARVWFGAEYVDVEGVDIGASDSASVAATGSLVAPMPGVITVINKSAGDTVVAGETLLVLEAMKMETEIHAPADGVLRTYRFQCGEQVEKGDLLVEFDEAE